MAAFFDPRADAIFRPSTASGTTPGKRIEQPVVFIKALEPCVSGSNRRPGADQALPRLRVGRGDHLRMGGVDRRVNHKADLVDRLVAGQDVAGVIDQLKVRHLDLAEVPRQLGDAEPIRTPDRGRRHARASP